MNEWKKVKKKETDRCQSSQGITADQHATTHFHPNISTFSVCVCVCHLTSLSPWMTVTTQGRQFVFLDLGQRQPCWNRTFTSPQRRLSRKHKKNYQWNESKVSVDPCSSWRNYVCCHTYTKKVNMRSQDLTMLFQLIGKVVENEILLKYRWCLFFLPLQCSVTVCSQQRWNEFFAQRNYIQSQCKDTNRCKLLKNFNTRNEFTYQRWDSPDILRLTFVKDICGHPELYDTTSYLYRDQTKKRRLLGEK